MTAVEPQRYFLEPQTPRQRQYEALRAYYLEALTQKQAAERFGYSISTFQTLASKFQNGKIEFFPIQKPGPKQRQTTQGVRNRIITLRKQNYSIYDIKDQLDQDNAGVSKQTILRILKEEGFAKLPRRSKKEQNLSIKGTILPPKAKKLDFNTLTSHHFECQVGGIYYFIPYILKTDLYDLVLRSSLPETNELSKVNSFFSLLALKLTGHERLSRISDYNLDSGFGFFAGLNVPPKATSASTYSYLVDKQTIDAFLLDFVSHMNKNFNNFYQGETINLDFHSTPHYGEKSQLDKNWVGSKHKSMKSALTFLAQDGESRALVYENADIQRKDADREILKFVDYWVKVKGIIKETLVFDSKLTTYSILDDLDRDNIKFITLRRRGKRLIERAHALPADAWITVDLKKPKRKHNKFKIAQSELVLPRTKLKVRQLIFKEHGRELPTFLVTNNFDLDIKTIALYYANRWLIENKISEIVDFFNLNALSSPFVFRIYFDVAMTVIADTLYRLLAHDLPRFELCTPKTIFADFINCSCKGAVTGDEVLVKLRKKKTTPIFKSHELFRQSWSVPWWGDKQLSYSWMA